ncbi:MAG: sulfurtransferase [Polyangiales bacterium]
MIHERKRVFGLIAALALLSLPGCDDDDLELVVKPDASADASADASSVVDAGSSIDASTLLDAALDATSDASTDAAAPTQLVPARVATLVNESAADYAHNRWGLIEGATLATYATQWNVVDSAAADALANGRPRNLAADARLVVLQLNAANRAAGELYVPSTPTSRVYTYELDSFRFNEVRDTGLISNSVRYQASGVTTDAWLARYGIDLRRDFVVFAAGENTAANGGFFQDLARAVYWLRYWGASIDRLAILNGTLKQNYAGALASTRTPDGALGNDGFSVKDLRVDHTSLTLPLESFLAVVDANLQASGVIEGYAKQFIIDARPTAQFNRTTNTAAFFTTHPGQFITTAFNSAGAPSEDATGQAKTYVPVEGHVRGAVSFPWASLLVDAGGGNYRYRPKAELAQIFASAGYAPTAKSDTVIVSQCRTNFEVQVNGFAALHILGYPTVHYDGSLVEYFSLVSGHPDASLNLQPSDAAYKFRTDTPARTQFYTASANPQAPSTTEDATGVAAYNVASGSTPTDRKIAQAQVRRDATTTRAALDADRAYKR